MINILIIEDEAIVALDLKTNLERIGYSVIGSTPSGEEALDLLDSLNPDLIITDIKLQGDMDGIDVAEILNEKFGIPFIILSAYSDEGIIERAKHVEPYGYIIKPFGTNNLRASIEMAMYRAKMKTEVNKLEMQLRQSEKLTAVGTLAGGIAHDFNNILTIILGYTTLIDEKLSLNENIETDIEGIRTAALRANSLTKHLLAFSRKQVLNPDFVGIDIIVGNISKMVSRIIPKNISLSVVNNSESHVVYIDQAQIEQVLLNLVLNAKDAMPDGGSLVLKSDVLKLHKKLLVTTGTVPKGDYISFSVKDSGTGISPENYNHIFDPFFTTKPLHKGTGLGLASVYGIIKQSGGYIDVISESGKGALFTVYLEISNKSVLVSKSTVKGEKAVYRGSETILVVEDEEEIRKLIVKMLNSNGYDVIESSNPGEAILLSENKEMSFDLLITDVFMPLMNGKQLSERLKTMGKQFYTVFISGYEEKKVQNLGINTNNNEYLSKPFQWLDLLSIVRLTLDGKVD
ncbi:MAG: response regulator [Spirochaetia bacterium]|jgi:two-component system cell cycle sensor histidine kinase/response regulator CckA|nr:response regulator [Spirochaetia bacterium]